MRESRGVCAAASHGNTDASSPFLFDACCVHWTRRRAACHRLRSFAKSLGMACRRRLCTRCSLLCLRGTNAQESAFAYLPAKMHAARPLLL